MTRLPRDETLPARVGDYVIDDLLGQGGFSVVYRATHADRATSAALKVLRAELASHPDVVARFEREVEVIRRLDHPNIVAIFEQGRLEGGCPYYAMELLEGVSLAERLQASTRLTAEGALQILEPLCGALELAHSRGIVHRDIKASNVFLATREGRQRVVLLDFGVAKLLDVPGPALTSSRSVVGTVACMSPEQIRGESVDPRTDVYALGVLTYRMLVGEQPFIERSDAMLRQLHLHVSPPRPSARARVDAALDRVILRAMSKDRAKRHPSVAAFLDDFRATLASLRGAGAQSGLRRALAVYAEVHADAAALEDPDDGLVADLDAILPFIAAELTGAGLVSAATTGSSVLFIAERFDDSASDAEARRHVVETLLAIHGRLTARAGRDPRVHVRLCVHAGEVEVGGDGAPSGGALLELAGWVPDEVEEGVFGSPAAVADLALASTPGGGGLVRIEAASDAAHGGA